MKQRPILKLRSSALSVTSRKNELVASACADFPDTPTNTLARKLYAEHGHLWPTFDACAQSAARIRQARTDFVLSLRRLLEALPGTYGDEGPALRTATAGMAEALGRWDRAIRAYQAPLEKVTGNADVHMALGTVHLERGRPKQAVDEFTAASRLAPDRAPAFLLLGLALDAVGRHADAA